MQDRKKCLDSAIERRQLGLVIKLLNQRFRHRFETNACTAGLDDVTIVHGRVLNFLARHAETDVFQRDIEVAFHISRSTVTSIMQVMEKNGLIERHSSPTDSRLKKVILTPHGLEMRRRTMDVIDHTEAELSAGLSPDEMDAFLAVAKKLEENLI